MNLSKTTKNYAKSRKLYIELDTEDYIINNPKTKYGVVWFGLDDGEEPAFKYIVNDDDSLSYAANVWAPRSVIEELPAHIKNEKGIRDVLNFLSKDKEFMANLEDEDF